MAMIVDDIAEHRIPLGIRTFSDLHSYVDANEYLLATACPWGSDVATQADDCGVRHHNAVTDRVQALLVATADMLAYDLELACTNDKHTHTEREDPRERALDYEIPMTCHAGTSNSRITVHDQITDTRDNQTAITDQRNLSPLTTLIDIERGDQFI